MPVLTICGIVIWPVEKTIAFGGVAAGSIKAQEAEIAAGAINRSGFIEAATAVAAKIGINIVDTAVLEVISVIKVISRQTDNIIMMTGKFDTADIPSPTHFARPVV